MNAQQPTTTQRHPEPRPRTTTERRPHEPEIVVLPHASMPVCDAQKSACVTPSLEDERGVVCEPMS